MDKAVFENLNILVIDDDMFIREVLVRMLARMGVRKITPAADGASAIDLVTKAPEPYDVIICDLEMPTMTGLECIRFLRMLDDPIASRTPVIILTGHTSQEHLDQAVSLGIHGFLSKPVSRQGLAARIEAAVTSPPIDPKPLKLGA